MDTMIRLRLLIAGYPGLTQPSEITQWAVNELATGNNESPVLELAILEPADDPLREAESVLAHYGLAVPTARDRDLVSVVWFADSVTRGRMSAREAAHKMYAVDPDDVDLKLLSELAELVSAFPDMPGYLTKLNADLVVCRDSAWREFELRSRKGWTAAGSIDSLS
ncbi:hypothetical protein BH10ACT5_BH10ACT5_00100 [soil metagenome]